MTSSYSFVSLYFHCERGNLEAAKAALQRGEDVNRVWQRGSCGNPFCTKDPFCDFKATPLQGAIKFGHTEVIALLLEQPNINVNVQSVYNYTALNLACMAGKTEVVKQLQQAPSIDPNIPNDFGRSPLKEAYVNNHRECVKALLELDQVTLPKTANGKPLELWFRKMCIAARHKRERGRDMARQREAVWQRTPRMMTNSMSRMRGNLEKMKDNLKKI